MFLPAATKLGQGNVFTGICHSVNRGEVCLCAYWDTPQNRHTPLGPDTSLGPDTPPDQTPPRSRHTPWDQTPPRPRHPLGPDTPWIRHPLGPDTPPPKQTPPSRSRHPLEQTHPLRSRADTPPRTPLPPGSTLRHMVNEWSVRILLECILVLLISFLQHNQKIVSHRKQRET